MVAPDDAVEAGKARFFGMDHAEGRRFEYQPPADAFAEDAACEPDQTSTRSIPPLFAAATYSGSH